MDILSALSLLVIAVIGLGAAWTWMLPDLRRRARQRATQSAHLVTQHLGGDASAAVVSERTYTLRTEADLQQFVIQELPKHLKIYAQHGLTSPYSHQPLTFTQVLATDHAGTSITLLRWGSLDVGGDQPLRVLKGSSLWLAELAGQRACLLFAPTEQFGTISGWRLALALQPSATAHQSAERFFASVDAALARSSCYRGRILSLSCRHPGHGQTSGEITVHRLKPVAREALILPLQTIQAVERNVIAHARHAPGLIARGQSARKGVLFHGPPGTGKTHCIRWLSGALPDHTVLLITAEQVGLLDDYMALARLLQPTLVVIEDVDLIARERTRMSSPGAESLLNKLLNEMDGLREDVQITFILTTNRPEDIEPAVASRLGRVDQAILFPLPDDACRRRLIALYANGMTLDETTISDLVARTAGASAAFLKELLRRATLGAEMRQGGAAVERQDVDAALEELLGAGGTISRSLLGGSGIAS